MSLRMCAKQEEEEQDYVHPQKSPDRETFHRMVKVGSITKP